MRPYPSTPLKFFFHFLKKYRPLVIIMLVLTPVSSLCVKFVSYYFSKFIDLITTNMDDPQNVWNGIVAILTAITVLEFLNILIRRILHLCGQRIEPDMNVRIKKDVTEYVLRHSVSYLTDQLVGKITDRVAQLADRSIRMFWSLMFGFFWPVTDIFITIVMLTMVNWKFSALFIFWCAVLTFVIMISSRGTQKYSAYRAERASITAGAIVDAIGNSLLVKSFSNLKFEQKIMEPLLTEERRSNEEVLRKIENSRLWQRGCVALFHISILVTAVYLWQTNVISPGNIVFVLLLTNGAMYFFQNLIFELLDWYRTTGIMKNALQIVSTPHGIIDDLDAPPIRVTKGKIDYKNVDFAYTANKPIFKNFSLSIKPGERIGLIGVSGSGKSTLISLLQRFYDVNAGAILIDGQNISRVTQDSLHENIAVIPQDTALFHRSLYENILYGNPTATREQVISASKRAFAHDFIMQTPGGYDSLVGDRGVRLSGGQRQRIAIARAILKNAPILILDEATSALDSESEQCIQRSMKSLMRGKTVIAIAHRLSTLKEMDKIVVMSKGKIIESGTPAQLLKKNGKYAKLWKLQTQVSNP